MIARGIAALALLAGLAAAQDAATVTEPGRGLERPLDMFFGAAVRGEVPERTSMIVLDPTASVQAAGFADALENALATNADALAATGLGLVVVGEDTTAVPPTRDHAAVVAEVRARLARPSNAFQNIYAAVRATAAALGRADGERRILLVTLDNGDAEDDLEATVAMLAKAKVELTAITSEAYLADSYWLARPYQSKPRDTTLHGGDAPVVDLPWGWLFQIVVANEVTPAATAPYAISRLAAASGGRVHLFSTPDQAKHVCGIYSACLFCTNDHLPQQESYRDGRVAPLTASTVSRDDALRQLGADPWFRAVVQAWKRSASEGLIRSQPPVRLQGTSARLDRPRNGRFLDLTNTLSLDRNARNAERAAADAAKIGVWLDEQLARIAEDQGAPRQQAGARYTRLMLQLTRLNLLIFAAWCREVAPAQLTHAEEPPQPPEVAVVFQDRRPVGIGFSSMCLCHGARPFLEVEIPGGAPVRAELEKFADAVDSFLARYGHTQYGFALHRAGIARFHFTYPGIAGEVPRQRPKSDSDDEGPTTQRPERPPRGGASSGGTAGPQTGGGRR